MALHDMTCDEQGESGKMSASNETSAIFVTDTPKQIKNKLNKYALTGGQDTKELQIQHGRQQCSFKGEMKTETKAKVDADSPVECTVTTQIIILW